MAIHIKHLHVCAYNYTYLYRCLQNIMDRVPDCHCERPVNSKECTHMLFCVRTSVHVSNTQWETNFMAHNFAVIIIKYRNCMGAHLFQETWNPNFMLQWGSLTALWPHCALSVHKVSMHNSYIDTCTCTIMSTWLHNTTYEWMDVDQCRNVHIVAPYIGFSSDMLKCMW